MDRRITFFVQGISLIYLVAWTSISKAQVPSPDESRRWSESASRTIESHYHAPDTTAKELGPFLAEVAFDLMPDGTVRHVRSIRHSRAFQTRTAIPEHDFRLVEKALIQAVRDSSPMELPRVPNTHPRVWSVVYDYRSDHQPVGRATLVARSKKDI